MRFSVPKALGQKANSIALADLTVFLFWINRNVNAPLAATTEHSFISAPIDKVTS